MNIVFVTQALPYLPCRDGFRLYGANLLRRLARRHQIHLISFLQGGDCDHLAWAKEHCLTLTTLSSNGGKGLLTRINLFTTYALGKPLRHRKNISSALAAGWEPRDLHVLHVEGDYAGGLVPPELPIPRVLSLQNSRKVRCAQMANCSTSRRERLYYHVLNRVEPRYERLVYPRFDCCVVVADKDARAIRAAAPESQLAVIPNGIDAEYYRPKSGTYRGPTLVFHGNLGYAPNVHAATEFAREIFPLIQRESHHAEFHLVGAKPVKQIRELASLPGIGLSANLPDLRNALCSSRVYVCPVRHGAGFKNKLLEAMAMGLPIIAYPEAVCGMNCTPGKHLLLAENVQEFVRLALELVNHPKRGEEIGRAARQHVVDNYSWDSRADEFESLYRQIIENRRERAGLSNPYPRPTPPARIGVPPVQALA